mgnify:CR=1 FL=1
MKTYEQGKAELDAKLNKLNQAIKHARKNTTYDFKCPQCKKITKKIVSYAKIGVGIKVCSAKCRAASYRDRKEKNLKEYYESQIHKLQRKIEELENETPRVHEDEIKGGWDEKETSKPAVR